MIEHLHCREHAEEYGYQYLRPVHRGFSLGQGDRKHWRLGIAFGTDDDA
jgi:hypothetical protein